MKYLVIILAVLCLSCGAHKPTPIVRDIAKTACISIVSCMPIGKLEGVDPLAFCQALETVGIIAEFIASQPEAEICPVE